MALSGWAVTVTLWCLLTSARLVSSGSCHVDHDCSPSTCCHAKECVLNAEAAPCDSVLCPATCMPHSLDCGGECRCTAGNCTAVIRAGRPPPGVEFRVPTPAPRLVGTGVAFVKVKRLVPVQRSRPVRKT